MFQFLIGKLRIRAYDTGKWVSVGFQFLIGKLRIPNSMDGSLLLNSVSIPYR